MSLKEFTKAVFTRYGLSEEHINIYYESLKTKKSKQTGELLKNTTLNGIIRNLKLFNHYLEETNQGFLPIDLHYEVKNEPEREILSRKDYVRFENLDIIRNPSRTTDGYFYDGNELWYLWGNYMA